MAFRLQRGSLTADSGQSRAQRGAASSIRGRRVAGDSANVFVGVFGACSWRLPYCRRHRSGRASRWPEVAPTRWRPSNTGHERQRRVRVHRRRRVRRLPPSAPGAMNPRAARAMRIMHSALRPSSSCEPDRLRPRNESLDRSPQGVESTQGPADLRRSPRARPDERAPSIRESRTASYGGHRTAFAGTPRRNPKSRQNSIHADKTLASLIREGVASGKQGY